MRSCMLRIYFECSKGYERRTAYAARVGIAFHRTLQSLTENPIGSSNPDVIVEQASLRFREELALQETQKARAHANRCSLVTRSGFSALWNR